MAFSVDAWGTPAIQPTPAVATAACAVQPQGSDLQLATNQELETIRPDKWLPCLVFPVYTRH
jgi:hypothetical protein